MNTLKKKGTLLLIAIMTVCVVWIPVYASDNTIGYGFDLKTGYVNAYSVGRYRETTNTENKWKVDMTYSSRGASAIVTYVSLGAENYLNQTATVLGYWDEETN